MKVPLSLLKSFLQLDVPIEAICGRLTLLGIEVDSVINDHPPFAKVVVGEVLSVKPHPNAEKLQIAEVHDGREAVQVVCGAANCRAGIKTAFAATGAWIADGEGKQRTIEKTSIRGVESNGMLCSADELHLWKDSGGIMELPQDWIKGADLASLLWDPILELSLTPNLGHAMSALGVARELAASMQKEIEHKAVTLSEDAKHPIGKKMAAHVEDFSICPRYMGRFIQNIKIGPSPFWLQKELYSCGLKPICNAVDITNYILIKRGQPLHAFDADRLEGGKLIIGPSKQNENWMGLDGMQHEIPSGTLIIRDAQKTVAVAGVLGGENSAVTDGTKNIFLEAAFFDPATVRKGAKKIGIRTDSAIRFEKGVDPNGVEEALDEAAHLIATFCQGTIAHGKIDLKKELFAPKKISLRLDRVNRLLGTRLSKSEIESLLQRLQMKTAAENEKTLLVEVPTYRFDVTEEIDLIEEVARLYGYNNIDKNPPLSQSSSIPHDPVYLFEKNLRKRCVALGLQEFLNSDLISPKLADLCIEFMTSRGIEFLKAIHAKTEEYSILRPSLLPGLLQSAKTNFDFKNQTFSAFEIGRIHFLQKEKCIEVPMLAFLLAGKGAPHDWSQKGEEANFYTLKGLLENLFEGLRISHASFRPSKHISFHPNRQADIFCGNVAIGALGEVHPELLAKMGIKERLLFAEIDIQHLIHFHQAKVQFAPIPHLPSSERDWTVSISQDTIIETLFESIRQNRPKILEKFELIDLYQREGQTDKNATIRFTYRDLVKTVSTEEVEVEHLKLISRITTQ